MKRNLYKIHRTLGILALIPVLVWTASGFMHPFMTWFKPKQPQTVTIPQAVKFETVKVGIDSILKINNIATVKQVRFIQANEKTYYQVKLPKQQELLYFDVSNGEKWQNGDKLYAEQLARYFIDEQKSAVASNTIVTEFSKNYKSVYKLLPVYEVKFQRDDNVRVYVETELSRIGTVIDDRRETFTWIFNNLHNWEFINFNETFRISFLMVVMTICFCSALSGLFVYGIFYKKFHPNAVTHRKFHRNLGITVSVAMLGFSFSGAFHAFQKLTPDDRFKYTYEPEIQVNNLPNFQKFQEIIAKYNAKNDVGNLFFAKMDKEYLLCLSHYDGKKATPIHTDFVQIANQTNLDGGCITYASFIADKFFVQKYINGNAGNDQKGGDCCETNEVADIANDKIAPAIPKISATNYVDKFEKEYGFFNKRLPVVKVAYETEGSKRLYVEYATGKLAAAIENKQALEGISFAYLHKYHLFEFLGKNTRDIIMMCFALGNFVVASLGMVMLLKRINMK
jgi:hypothetical protein